MAQRMDAIEDDMESQLYSEFASQSSLVDVSERVESGFKSSTNGNIKVYIRCASKAMDVSEECVRILSPNQESLVVNTQISKDCSSMNLYDAKYVFDSKIDDNQSVFEVMCKSYLQQIIEFEENETESEDLFHPVFITFGQTNSGKTHSLIGCVDEIEETPLNGFLVQFVSNIFEYFESKDKACNMKICGLEEYGECLNTLKLYDLFANRKTTKNMNFEQVIGSPPSKSKNSRPTFVQIEDIKDLEQLMSDGCESIHCGLFDNKIVSCGHCLFQLKINNKYCISFFDLSGYHPNHNLDNNIIPSNLTLNQFIKMLYHHHHDSHNNVSKSMYIPTQSVGLIPNLQNILFENSDIVFLLHISDHRKDIQHTLKTLEIAKMFPNKNKEKTLIHLDAFSIDPPQEEEETVAKQPQSLLFSPAPKIRMRKRDRASSVLLSTAKTNINELAITSRRRVSAMPLEILQLKKSKSKPDKTFLVPLGFSTYDCFVVEREDSEETEQNRLELQLRTNRSKFYILIDDYQKMMTWIQTEIATCTAVDVALDSKPNEDIESELDNDSTDANDGLNYDYSCKAKPLLILSLLLNALCVVILCGMDYVDAELSQPLRRQWSRVSNGFETIYDKYHQHKYQYDEIISLYAELNTITSYCDDYIQSTVTTNKDLLEFCETFINAHNTCPIDLLSL
eukprot:69873_1